MQRTENVTSPKQVYRGPYYQKPTGENHYYTHNPWEIGSPLGVWSATLPLGCPASLGDAMLFTRRVWFPLRGSFFQVVVSGRRASW